MTPETYHRCAFCTLLFELETPAAHATLLIPRRIRALGDRVESELAIGTSGPEWRPKAPADHLLICTACLAYLQALRGTIKTFRESVDAAHTPSVERDTRVAGYVDDMFRNTPRPVVVDRRRVYE